LVDIEFWNDLRRKVSFYIDSESTTAYQSYAGILGYICKEFYHLGKKESSNTIVIKKDSHIKIVNTEKD